MSSNKKRIAWRAVNILWIAACVSILLLSVVYRGPEYRDAIEAEAIIMIALSFPLGWIFAYLCFGTIMGGSYTTELQWILLVWATLFVVGYLQWFVLLPFVARRIGRMTRRRETDNASFVPK